MKMLTQLSIVLMTTLLSYLSCTPDDAVKKDPAPKEVNKDCCGVQPVEWTTDRGGYIFMPNAFTPNGDGVNDVFYPIVNDEDFVYFNMVVFAGKWDTSGIKLFHQEIINRKDSERRGWNGTFPDGRPYKGLFTYLVTYFNHKGAEYTMGGQGEACAIDCSDAGEFAERQGCFYPVQAVNGKLDKSKGNQEEDCFN